MKIPGQFSTEINKIPIQHSSAGVLNSGHKIFTNLNHGEPFLGRKGVDKERHFIPQALFGQEAFAGDHAVEVLGPIFTV